jgi:alginate O-acetyltransferase complex protein AlgI
VQNRLTWGGSADCQSNVRNPSVAFTSYSFIALVLTAVLLTSLLPSPRARKWLLCAANLVFIGSYVDRVSQVIPLSAFLALCFVAIEVARRTRSSVSQWIGLLLILSSFILLKKFSFLAPSLTLPFPYLMLGLSYVLFRALHLLIDAKQGELQQPIAPLEFFNYTCNFLTFIAGPIQRYEAYQVQEQRPLGLDEGTVFRAFARITKGFLKVAVVSAIFEELFNTVSARLLGHAQPDLLGTAQFGGMYVTAALFYTIYLYANFAGYVDIVIGVGTLLGQDLPENFNHPFLARNFLEFWSRWHITLSEWFRTYVFNPLLKVLAGRYTMPRAAPYLMVFAFFVTFLIMGVWHGTTPVFVVYGLLMGAGASLNKLWQVVMAKQLGKQRYRALAEQTAAVYFSRGLTLAYFTLALTCLWVDLPQLRFVATELGVLGIVGCYLGLAAGSGVVFFVWDSLVRRLASLRASASDAFAGVIAQNLGLGVQVLVIATVASFFHKAPEFVYRAF